MCGVMLACLVAGLGGCAGQQPSMDRGSVSDAGSPGQETAVHRAIAQCFVSVGIGAVGGAILGAALGRNGGGGALVGAAVGAGACAVLLKVAADQDQAQINQFGRQAVSSNTTTSQSFTTTKGEAAVVTTVVSPATPPQAPPTQVASAATKFTDCRYAAQAVQVGGQTASVDKQLWCRLDTGDWKEIS